MAHEHASSKITRHSWVFIRNLTSKQLLKKINKKPQAFKDYFLELGVLLLPFNLNVSGELY